MAIYVFEVAGDVNARDTFNATPKMADSAHNDHYASVAITVHKEANLSAGDYQQIADMF